MVVEPRADGNVLYDHQLNNKYSFNGNTLLGINGTHYIHVPIISSGDTPKVRLYLFGKAAGASATALVHGVNRHYHGYAQFNVSSGEVGWLNFDKLNGSGSWENATSSVGFRIQNGDSTAPYIGDSSYSTTIPYTAVPQAVQIWIDGTEYTATIGDPNTKGATMYDSTNDDWGIDGTTVWNTGELDLSSVISWTVGDHYIEIKETGGTGGTLIYTVLVN